MDKLGQEWVSAAVDGEADEQVLAKLASDTDSHNQWRNYHMIGDAMRGELPKTIALDLSASIMDAIAQEPAHTATGKTDIDSGRQTGANVVPLFKQFGQYAIAATVAVMAIVGVQNYQTGNEAEPSPLPVLNTRPLIGSASPVSLQTGPVQPQGYNNEQLLEQRRRINAYIQDHMLQQRLNTGAVMDDNSETISDPASHR
jgi:sigma-E factor negative regulatory protein RseA